MHPAHEGLGLVAAEIVAELVAQDGVDFRHRFMDALFVGVAVATLRACCVEQASHGAQLDELLPHLLDRNGKVDEAGGDCALRHVGMAGPETVCRLGEVSARPVP